MADLSSAKTGFFGRAVGGTGVEDIRATEREYYRRMFASGFRVGSNGAIGAPTGFGYINIQAPPYNAAADGVTLDTAAFSDALAAGNYVYAPPGTYSVESFTVASGKTLMFARGAVLNIIPGATVTINGGIEPCHWQIFSSTDITTATAPVRFNGGCRNDWFSSAWWGTVGDDETDNSIPLQQAFIAANNITGQQTRNGSKLIIPPGKYRFGTTLHVKPTLPGTQTQAAYHFTIEGAIGTKNDVGAGILTTALMQTQLRYTGSGAGVDVVGIEIGDWANKTYAQTGCVLRHLWFVAPTNCRAIVRAYCTSALVEHCAFSTGGTTLSAGSYVDVGIRIAGFENTIRDCSFHDTYGGAHIDEGNGCVVERCVFKSLRAGGVYVSGTMNVIQGNVFQDVTGANINADLTTIGTTINGLSIRDNYNESTLSNSGGFYEIAGASSANRAKGVCIENNYFNSTGSTAPAFVRAANTDGLVVGHNYWPDFPPSGGLSRELVELNGTGNINVTIVKEGRTIAVTTNTTFTDAQACAYLYTNSGAAGSVTFTLPNAYSGMTWHIAKVTDQTVVLDAAGAETIDGATTLTNSTSADTGKAMVYLRAVAAGVWMVESKTGTWT